MGFFGDNFEDPRTQGILQAAAAMLGSRGQNFGQSLGAGLQAGLGGYGDAQKIQSAMLMRKAEDEQRRRLQESQIEKNESQIQQREMALQIQQANQKFLSQFTPQDNQQQAAPQMQQPSGVQNTDSTYSVPINGQAQPQMQQSPPQRSQLRIEDLSPEQVMQLNSATGKDYTPLWLATKNGAVSKEGEVRTSLTTGKRTHTPKLEQGITYDSQGNAIQVPSYGKSVAEIEAAKLRATETVKDEFATVEALDPQGNKILVPKNVARQGGAILGRSTNSETFSNALEKSAADNYDVIQKQGATSTNNAVKAKQITSLLKANGGHPLGATWQAIAKTASALGVVVDKNIDGVEGATALAEGLASQMRPAGIGAQSNYELESYKAQIPNLLTTPGGRAIIAENFQAQANRDVAVAEMYRTWVKNYGSPNKADSKGRILEDYIVQYTQKNPIFKVK